MRVAELKTANSPKNVLVSITSEDKPEISEELQNKWQQIVDLAARIIGVPSGLITRLSEKQLEVFLTSNTENNIFERNLKLDLGVGWYCENVAGNRKELILPYAYESDEWKENNPSLPFNMVSYLGIPIFWPDGEIFGTFCMLDNKKNEYSNTYKDLLLSLREIIQNDLKSTQLYQKAKDDILKKEMQIREVHHRVKNHFNLLLNTLNFQAMVYKQENTREKLISEIQSRIFAISSIHDKLYHSINVCETLLGEYLSGLGKYIINTLADKPIRYIFESDEIHMDADRLVPCGLILNELITNSVKHAFNGISDPEIFVSIVKNEDKIKFIYADNGNGIEPDFDLSSCESLGMILINQLSLQLNGEISIENVNGFQFSLIF